MTSNSDTRRFEYPWAFHATPLGPGISVVEIGGGRSGFQFALSKTGSDVLNVDTSEGKPHWGVTSELIERANRAFGTSVRLATEPLPELALAQSSVDRVFSISTIEHIPLAELRPLMEEVGRILRPGGFFVATVDLFLDVRPFTTLEENRYGRNVDVKQLLEWAGLTLLEGDRSELHGFEEFQCERILERLPEYLYSFSYPGLAQAFVAGK